MELTEEQQERIRKNRERALEIQRKRREEREKKQREQENLEEENNRSNGFGKTTTTTTTTKRAGENGENVEWNKRMRVEQKMGQQQQKKDTNGKIGEEADYNDDDLEAFEEGASELVSKSEAKKMYCLPEGSLACCKVVEKENPKHRLWSKMKLYYRSELRRRARKRYGGKDGLIAERRKREEERFRNDIEKTKNIFKK